MATRKEAEKKPQISEISPMAAIAGGEFHIRGTGFAPPQVGLALASETWMRPS